MIKNLNINETEDGIVEVEAVIENKAVKDSYQKSSQKVQDKSVLKGFRKGKAPLHLVQNVYKGEIQYETVNGIFPSIYDTLIKEHKINPIATPEISGLDDFSLEEDLTLKMKIEIAPYVKEMPELSTIHPDKVEYSYNEEDLLEKEVESLQQIHATYQPLTGEVKEGDFVQVRYSIDSPNFKRGETTHYVMVKKNDPQFEFTSHLIGKKLGETSEEEITFSSIYVDQELADKTVKINFTPIEGRTIELPEINNELAQKFKFDTLDALKEEIRVILKKRAEMKGIFDSADNVFAALADKATFSIGEKVILSQTQSQLQKKLQDIMKEGKFNDYSKENGFNDEAFIQEVKDDAQKSIEKYLINQKLIEKFNISSTDTELDQFIVEISEQEIPNRKEIIDFYKQNPSKKEDLKHQLLTKKLALKLQESVSFDKTDKKTMEHQILGA